MVTVGVFHNGTTNLPLKRTEEGEIIPDASLAEVQKDNQQVVKDQIRQAVLAEKHGFDSAAFTEHHFQPTGAEFSTNPQMSQMYAAAETESIRLIQMANVLTWHDPIRLAEQTSLLDIMSDGRVEVGLGRGYQPRENEQFGQFWGGTIQDQERNRMSYEEKYEILVKAMTEELVSYHGEYHYVPPTHTKHHHSQDHAYLSDDVTEQNIEEFIDWQEDGDLYSDLWNPVVSGGSKLQSQFVTPQPVQDPHPQLWQPVTSKRSIRFCAKHGLNGYFNAEPNELLTDRIDWYYDAVEEFGWPDHRPEVDGEPFKYGWDEERHRGLAVSRSVFNTEVADEDTFERWKMGQEHMWNYYGPFGFSAIFSEDRDPSITVTAEMLMDHEVAIVGDTEEIVDQIMRIVEICGFENLYFNAQFETGSVTGEEADEQLKAFGERVIPHLEEELPSDG